MAPFIYRADNIELVPSAPATPESNIFDMVLTHAGLNHRFTFRATYVDQELVSTLARKGECEVHLVAMDTNSLASLLVKGRPQFVVTGLTRKGEPSMAKLPSAWTLARLFGTVFSLAMVVTGLAMAAGGASILGALLCLAGALAWGPASQLPARPLLGHEAEYLSKLGAYGSKVLPASDVLADRPQSPGT